MADRKVYKFAVPIDGAWHEVALPRGANLVHVGKTVFDTNREYLSNVDRNLYFWAEVNPARVSTARLFRAYATGENIEDSFSLWMGTLIEDGLVWHLYMKDA